MTKRKSKTCIAVCRLKSGEILMAGDRRISMDDGSIYKAPKPKIKKTWNGILTGASGTSGLCKTIVDMFEPPKVETEDTDLYMYYHYVPELHKHLKQIPGFTNEHRMLSLASSEGCDVLVVVQDFGYIINIYSEGADEGRGIVLSRIQLDDAPIPYAIGCGAISALPVLIDECKSKGYNTKTGLIKAMNIAADLNNGCDNSIDYISNID